MCVRLKWVANQTSPWVGPGGTQLQTLRNLDKCHFFWEVDLFMQRTSLDANN